MMDAIKIELNCESCAGMCCLNPPQINDEIELEKAKKFGAEVIAVQVDDRYILTIVKKNDACPFLDENGNCSIYEDRFSSCREYQCLAVQEPISPSLFVNANFLKSKTAKTQPKRFLKEDVEKFGVKIVRLEEAVQLTALSNAGKYYSMLEKTLISISKENKFLFSK